MSFLNDVEVKRHNGVDILIDPLSESSLKGTGYSLRIGCAIKDSDTDTREFIMKDGDQFTLLPGEGVYIVTEEFVWLSKKYSGSFSLRGKLGMLGLVLCNASTIDPSWRSDLYFYLKNVGRHSVGLRHGERIIEMRLHRSVRPSKAAQPTGVLTIFETVGVISAQMSDALSRYKHSNEYRKREIAFSTAVERAIRKSEWPQYVYSVVGVLSAYAVLRLAFEYYPTLLPFLTAAGSALLTVNWREWLKDVIMPTAAIIAGLYFKYRQRITRESRRARVGE
jgi:deoxycytidine triphosphate deaminase